MSTRDQRENGYSRGTLMTETNDEVERLTNGGTRVSRRHLLTAAGAGATGLVLFAGGAAAGYEHQAAPPVTHSPPARPDGWVLTFRSRPDLSPPRVHMIDLDAPTTTEYFFITPNKGPSQLGSGQQGLMILDRRGEIVWFRRLGPAFSNFRVQTYKDEPVLTWWQGDFLAAGFGRGDSLIADTSYQPLATVRAANGLRADMHEFELTQQGTALITAYATRTADLRSIGGSKDHPVYDGVAQEIDVATGKLLFEWRSLDHVSVEETYNKPKPNDVFDFFHINSIGVDPTDGNLLISGRNTWTVYKVDRSTGKILWRLNGKHSDFTMGTGASFAWQHHARAHGNGVLSVFDDAASPQVEPQSRGLLLALDTASHSAKLIRAFTHPARLVADNQGSLQLLADGGVVIGWGNEPYLSEFAADGTLVRDGRMPTNEESYRAYRCPFSATPPGVPDVAVEADDVNGYTVYVSWNGATEVARWQLLTGNEPSHLAETASAAKAGFETAVTVHPKGKYLAARALDASGQTLATSRTVRL